MPQRFSGIYILIQKVSTICILRFARAKHNIPFFFAPAGADQPVGEGPAGSSGAGEREGGRSRCVCVCERNSVCVCVCGGWGL